MGIEAVTYSLAEVIAELCAKQSCTRCGGPLVGGKSINGPEPGEVLCHNCLSEWADQYLAEREAEYWAQRAELERECHE